MIKSLDNRSEMANREIQQYSFADYVLERLQGCYWNGVAEPRRQTEVKRQEDRRAKLRLRLWVVATGGRRDGRRHG